jgi:hypothetical protein
MQNKTPSILTCLEIHKNISVRELGVINHTKNYQEALLNGEIFIKNDIKFSQALQNFTINTCETIEIVDIQTLTVLFLVQIPKVKSWLISVVDVKKIGRENCETKHKTIEEACNFIENQICPEIARLENARVESLHEKLSTDLKMQALLKNPFSKFILYTN